MWLTISLYRVFFFGGGIGVCDCRGRKRSIFLCVSEFFVLFTLRKTCVKEMAPHGLSQWCLWVNETFPPSSRPRPANGRGLCERVTWPVVVFEKWQAPPNIPRVCLYFFFQNRGIPDGLTRDTGLEINRRTCLRVWESVYDYKILFYTNGYWHRQQRPLDVSKRTSVVNPWPSASAETLRYGHCAIP